MCRGNHIGGGEKRREGSQKEEEEACSQEKGERIVKIMFYILRCFLLY